MSRALTTREKVLVAILAVLLVVLVYYLLVYQPVRDELASLAASQMDIETTLQVEEARAVQLEKMRQELEELRRSGDSNIVPMPEFDNIQSVMTELNTILAAAVYYDLSFSPVVTEDNLVRRAIGMSFGCDSYAQARAILQRLDDCRYRCQIGDVSLTAALSGTANTSEQETDLTRDSVQVSLTVTFYEMIEK